MPNFNGISAIPDPKWLGPNALFSTDASLQGAGGWSQGEYFFELFPTALVNDTRISINELEAITVMVGLKLWGHKVAGRKFLIQCDNTNTVQAINTGRAKNVVMQQVLREICYILALNDAQVRAVFVPSAQNRICDSLSRWYMGNKFRLRFSKITTGLITNRVYVNKALFFLSK